MLTKALPWGTHGQSTAFPAIRLLTVPKVNAGKPRIDMKAEPWTPCSPETVAAFSAVGFFFGRELHERLGVPVGLINASWGGTVAEAWTSREGLLAEPAVRGILEKYERDLPNLARLEQAWQAELAAIDERTHDRGIAAAARQWSDQATPAGDWQDMDLPGSWQSKGLDFNGVVWFRKNIDLPGDWAGNDLHVSIGATDKSDITFFNGEQVGSITMAQRPDAWSVLRTYTVPGRLVRSGQNTIAVRVHSDRFAGGMTGPAALMHVTCPGLDGALPVPLTGTWQYAVEKSYGRVIVPPAPPGPGNPNSPCVLFNGMIAPLVPSAIRGAIWYQGESNTDRPREYQSLFPALIRDWRRCWGQGDFPFLFVQLANYLATLPEPSESQWAELREAQAMALRLPHTGMATAIDLGEADDVHPRNKQDVGLRLAKNALARIHNVPGAVCSGPVFIDARFEGDAIRVSFDHADGGLVWRGDEPRGFAVARADGVFVWAKAHIEGDTVVVRAPGVDRPRAVRYAWANNPVCGLYNTAGLPACPFRTDQRTA